MQIISWQTYWTTLLLVLVAYYLLIGLLYFKKELRQLFRKKTKMAFPARPEEDNLYTQAGALATSLQNIIAHALLQKEPKDALLASIRRQIQLYPDLRRTDFARGINDELNQQLAASYPVRADELKGLWD